MDDEQPHPPTPPHVLILRYWTVSAYNTLAYLDATSTPATVHDLHDQVKATDQPRLEY